MVSFALMIFSLASVRAAFNNSNSLLNRSSSILSLCAVVLVLWLKPGCVNNNYASMTTLEMLITPGQVSLSLDVFILSGVMESTRISILTF